jgi:hypothetical protein
MQNDKMDAKAERQEFAKRQEFERLVRENQSGLLAFLLSLTGNLPDSEEILVPDELADVFSSLFTSNRLRIKWTKIDGATHPTATSIQHRRPKEGEGTTEGTVVAKQNDKWIEIKSTEGTIRRYVPRWTGGGPYKGGRLDFVAQKVIRKAKLGSKVQVEWIWDERVRLINLLPIN